MNLPHLFFPCDCLLTSKFFFFFFRKIGFFQMAPKASVAAPKAAPKAAAAAKPAAAKAAAPAPAAKKAAPAPKGMISFFFVVVVAETGFW